MLELELKVKPDAALGSTELLFQDGARPYDASIFNRLFVQGEALPPGVTNSYIFINALINIVGDVAAFVRGDSNGDLKVNISDPQHTLSHLFLGGPSPSCWDAADANADGRVDISDAVATLSALFLGTGPPPDPSGAPGEDPTADGLTCFPRR